MLQNIVRTTLIAAALAPGLITQARAHAGFPARPVVLVVPFTPGEQSGAEMQAAVRPVQSSLR